MDAQIFTIGYGNRNIETFIGLLKKYGIEVLVDVRTRPLSRFHPDFRRQKLDSHLSANGIRYVFMGNELGGKPADESCYANGRIDYAKVRTKQFFADGIGKVLELHDQGLNLALMCAELSPLSCHRKAMIGDYLAEKGFEVKHIDVDGSILNVLF